MPQHKRGPWSQQEDQLLLHLVTVHGASNWVRISAAIQTRSPKQCRERFHQNLKPNLNHDPITPEEGILIEQMVAEMGKRWAEIARRLHGRSDNAVKNWWNGGMNRRRRSVQQRRTELEVRQQMHVSNQMQAHAAAAAAMPQQPLPQAFQHHQMMQQHYFNQQMYHAGHGHPQMSIPSNIPAAYRQGMVDTPLPSPSAFSQMSADGAPSLISDCSSLSARSPHNGTSPIELPPLSGARDERRRSSAPMLRLGVPGSFVQGDEFAMAQMQMQQEMQQPKTAPMLQEPFMPQPQGMLHPSQYLPSQPRQPSPLHQSHAMSQQFQQHMQQQQQQHQQHTLQRRHSAYPIPTQSVPSTPVVMQLPSISNMAADNAKLDPALANPALDDSPRDKMSLSNLTH